MFTRDDNMTSEQFTVKLDEISSKLLQFDVMKCNVRVNIHKRQQTHF